MCLGNLYAHFTYFLNDSSSVKSFTHFASNRSTKFLLPVYQDTENAQNNESM